MIRMNTIILSFQIRFPFLDSRSLDNSKSLFGKRFDLLSWSLPLTKVLEDWDVASSEPKTKRYDRNRQMLLLLFKNFLTGPGSSLLPFLFLPGFCLYLLLGFLLRLVVALPRHLLGQPQSSFSPLWPGATHFSS